MNTQRILTEKDPFIREIWTCGFEAVEANLSSRSIKFIREDGTYKEIGQFDFEDFCSKLTIKGERGGYRFLSDADGSAQKFKEFMLKA
jgi:hypothetical protein